MGEEWIDIRIVTADGNQQNMVTGFVMPVLQRLEKERVGFRTFHFLHEPEGFLFRVATENDKTYEKVMNVIRECLDELAASVKEWYHAKDRGWPIYVGEAAFYGKNGWVSMEKSLEFGSRIAILQEQYPPENGLVSQLERMIHCFYNANGLNLSQEIDVGVEGIFQRLGVICQGRDENCAQVDNLRSQMESAIRVILDARPQQRTL